MIAKAMREARHRHEKLGVTPEEAAFYDALAGSADDIQADPKIAEIAAALVRSIRADLTVDWTDRESTTAKIRMKIKHLLRTKKYAPPTTRLTWSSSYTITASLLAHLEFVVHIRFFQLS